MITVFLLIPVAAVLGWLYWYLLPGGRSWTAFDTALFLLLAGLATAWVAWAMTARSDDAGPLWPDLLSAAGAYGIIALGLAAGLAWRRLTPFRSVGVLRSSERRS
jgi:hypothetical protein